MQSLVQWPGHSRCILPARTCHVGGSVVKRAGAMYGEGMNRRMAEGAKAVLPKDGARGRALEILERRRRLAGEWPRVVQRLVITGVALGLIVERGLQQR